MEKIILLNKINITQNALIQFPIKNSNKNKLTFSPQI